MPSGTNEGGYRRVGQAAGPGSSHAEYTATLDPGMAASVSGGQESLREHTCSSCGATNQPGAKFCVNCGSQLFA